MAGPAPSSGRLDKTVHSLPVRIYYEDTDAGGIVYHANYLRYFERARTEMLRVLGIDHVAAWSQAAPGSRVGFAVRSVTLDYRAPAFLDDALKVCTQVAHVGAAHVDADQWIVRDGTILAHARIRVALVDDGGRPRRLPPEWRAKLKQVAQAATQEDDTATLAGH